MARSSYTIELLSAEDEPKYSVYQHACDQIVQEPQILSDLVNDQHSSDLLFCATRHSHRIGKLLDRVFVRQNQTSRQFPLEAIATATIVLFKHLISNSQVAGATQVINCLLPALHTCVASKVPQVRDLMSVLICHDSLVEHLLAKQAGAKVVNFWAWSPISNVRDAATLQAWTNKLVNMIKHCINHHGLTAEISDWEKLNDLKDLLQKLSHRHTARCESQANQQNLLALTGMSKLDPTQKKSHAGQSHEPRNAFLEVPADIRTLLNHFGLETPTSLRKSEELIERLENENTLSIFRGAVTTFPCKLCNTKIHGGLDHGESKAIVADSEDVIPLSKFDMSVFGKRVGVWEVLLSTSAWSTLQEKKRSKISQSIEEKLSTLGSGNGLAGFRMGPRTARKQFKVPVFNTKCTPNLYLIWQVDINVGRESRKPEQVVKVWAIVEKSGISKVLDHVKTIQETWPQKKVEDCCARSPSSDKEIVPKVFDDASASVESEMGEQTRIDVRTMGPELSNLVSKVYAFTEPVLQAQIFSDMTLELPYMLSKAEMEVVCHWETPSLILGRSGTGKTTCLAYQLMGKHLANKTSASERPIRQVFLTRSRRLVGRLRIHVQKSIKTLLMSPLDDGITEAEGGDASGFDTARSTVLDLSASPFPFFCTFEDFMQLLENTVITADPSMIRMHRVSREGHGHSGSPEGNRVDDIGHCIDFATFELDYWPKLPRTVTSQLPLSLVYAEIMGVIKGSATSINSLNALTLEEYLQRSSRIAPTFTLELERTLVYQAFERYEDLKRDRQAVDYADRVIDILRAMQTEPTLQRMLSSVVDELYIDEVQDQRCVDIALFLRLLKDSRGFHAGGDTAQAISQDSNFRFADIKKMVYEHSNRFSSSNDRKTMAQATMFKLKENYRSHHGIVNLASFVMNLLWQAFPQTVDKLPPESGQLLGPMPVMFTGCEPDVLAHNKLNSSNLPAKATGFGAQQSKGMEFNDVILYNFFSSCSDPGGLRRLPALLDADLGVFDPAEHPAMYTELKNLYVACTRARNKLFMFETSDEKELAPTISMLTQGSKGPMVRLITRDDPSFDEHLQLLYKDNSTTPQQWIDRGEETMADRNYDEAYRCFERAGDERGMKLVTANLRYEEGRKGLAGNDRELAVPAFEDAAALFLELNLDGDAAKVFCSMGAFDRAAELWLRRGKYDQAARLFIRALLYTRAADCHDQAGRHEEAASVLWQGKEYDSLVRYLNRHRAAIPAEVSQAYGTRCVFPMKQDKISPSHRKEAISLLGSSRERERIFRQFDMHDALDELYLDTGRIQDLFDLRFQLGNLDAALQLVLSKKTAERLQGISEERIHLLIDYEVTSRLTEAARRKKLADVRMLHGLQKLTKSGHENRLQQWKFSLGCLAYGYGAQAPSLTDIEDERLRFIVGLQLLDPKTIRNATSFECLLSDALGESIRTVKDVMLKKKEISLPILLTACGVWATGNPHDPYIIFSWSPLSTADASSQPDGLLALVKEWVMRKFTNALLALHEASRPLWLAIWPMRCVRHMTKGNCQPAKGKNDRHWSHEGVTRDSFAAAIQRLLRLNSIFCDLTALYRNVTYGQFKKEFPGIRRAWQERLIRLLTWVSAFEQHDATVKDAQRRILLGRRFASVAGDLEALLFYRLKNEWEERREYSSLLEQMQLATTLGAEKRFFRALSHMLWSEPQGRTIWGHLSVIRKLENDVVDPNASTLSKNLDELRTRLDQLEIEAFESFHSITTVFEYLATHIIVKISDQSFIVPRSWITLHVSRLCEAGSDLKAGQESDRKIYEQCLVKLTNNFCHLLTWLDSRLTRNSDFRIGNHTYKIALLQRRNAELLAVARLNLGLSCADLSRFTQTTTAVNEALALDTVREGNLAYTGSNYRACKQLVESAATYTGKNPLMIFQKESTQSVSVSELGLKLKLGTLTSEWLLAQLSPNQKHRSCNEQPAGGDSESGDRFTSEQMECIQKFQQRWRRHLSQTRQQRLLLIHSSKHRQIARFQRLTAASPPLLRVHLRFLLTTRGVQVTLNLHETQIRFSALHKAIKAAVRTASESAYETVGEALRRCDGVQATLDLAARHFSDDELHQVIHDGDLDEIQSYLEWVQTYVGKAHGEILAVEKVF
ncbi:MAG: hypothetical protein Q9196_002143 [Gyalolechia fulgens]